MASSTARNGLVCAGITAIAAIKFCRKRTLGVSECDFDKINVLKKRRTMSIRGKQASFSFEGGEHLSVVGIA